MASPEPGAAAGGGREESVTRGTESGKEGGMPGLTTIDLVKVDDDATHYATYQSHNQKLVSNRNGLFMTHIRRRTEDYMAQQWRLSRSTDGGRSFTTIYEATHPTNPPVLETDEAGNVYLIRPDFVDENAYLYRFRASDEYAQPLISKIEGAVAGKYAMAHDPKRGLLYYAGHTFGDHMRFCAVGLDGEVQRSTDLLVKGPSALPQYPSLCVDREGVLHLAWTTLALRPQAIYWSIHFIQSGDGGKTWRKMDGALLKPPIVADEHGPTDRVTLDDEYEVLTWLSNFLVQDGKAHFIYLAQFPAGLRQHYVRYDLKSAKKDRDVWPKFAGQELSLLHTSGFFAARAALPDAPLYCVLAQEKRVACLASDDSGATWYDYAVSREMRNMYSIGGCREVTAGGHVIGSFTETVEGAPVPVYCLRFQAGLAAARVTSARCTNGRVILAFADVHGQPQEIRLRRGDAAWGEWLPFAPDVTAAADAMPTHFQLRSRMGVVSDAYSLPAA